LERSRLHLGWINDPNWPVQGGHVDTNGGLNKDGGEYDDECVLAGDAKLESTVGIFAASDDHHSLVMAAFEYFIDSRFYYLPPHIKR
jgi:hypothetical protein